MNAIPAAIAGVTEVVMCTPPRRDGTVAAAVLVAADLCGCMRSTRWAAPRQWPLWPMGPHRFRGWTRSSVPATSLLRRPSGWSSGRWGST
ncbi:MAG: histidinol dehydrogenase [Candidatus Methylomirabilis sp.]|nr:histidinol dehydrogenase [Candidatus Methylomirabilis sp.]